MMKERNLTVGYHGGQIHILPILLLFTKMAYKHLIENLVIGNKRDNIPPFFTSHHVLHVQKKLV